MVRQSQLLKLSPDIHHLKRYQRWKAANDGDFSLWDFLFKTSTAEVVIALTTLFLPEFIEYEGGIFLAETFNEKLYYQWKEQLGNDINAIERVINHQHIDDILSGTQKVGEQNLLYLGQAIAQMWDCRLKSLYPEREFLVYCDNDETTVTISFCQNSHNSKYIPGTLADTLNQLGEIIGAIAEVQTNS